MSSWHTAAKQCTNTSPKQFSERSTDRSTIKHHTYRCSKQCTICCTVSSNCCTKHTCTNQYRRNLSTNPKQLCNM